MSIVVDNILLNRSTDVTYNLVLNSNDRTGGTHNNATFNIDWNTFLPVNNPEYKICFTYQSTGGYYCDGVFQKNPLAPTTGVTNLTTSTATTSAGITLQSATNTGMTVGNFTYTVWGSLPELLSQLSLHILQCCRSPYLPVLQLAQFLNQ